MPWILGTSTDHYWWWLGLWVPVLTTRYVEWDSVNLYLPLGEMTDTLCTSSDNLGRWLVSGYRYWPVGEMIRTLDTSNDLYVRWIGLWVQALNFKGDDLDSGYLYWALEKISGTLVLVLTSRKMTVTLESITYWLLWEMTCTMGIRTDL